MENISFIKICMGVIRSPYVIGTLVVVAIFISFGNYVSRYSQKSAKSMKPRRVVSKPAAAPPPAASSDEQEEAGEE